jgi:Icc protein
MPSVKHMQGINRRSWLKRFGLGAAAATAGLSGRVPLLSGSSALAAPAPPVSPAAGRSIRIAQLTDIHLQPERGAVEGFTQCLHHMQSQADRPDLIVFTGDLIMDSYRKPDARTAVQWDLWGRVLKAECSLPHMALLGNHDIWGWDKKKSKTTGNEPGWGKKRATDQLGLARPYYSFDRNGWHFVMLDSVQPFGDGGY